MSARVHVALACAGVLLGPVVGLHWQALRTLPDSFWVCTSQPIELMPMAMRRDEKKLLVVAKDDDAQLTILWNRGPSGRVTRVETALGATATGAKPLSGSTGGYVIIIAGRRIGGTVARKWRRMLGIRWPWHVYAFSGRSEKRRGWEYHEVVKVPGDPYD